MPLVLYEFSLQQIGLCCYMKGEVITIITFCHGLFIYFIKFNLNQSQRIIQVRRNHHHQPIDHTDVETFYWRGEDCDLLVALQATARDHTSIKNLNHHGTSPDISVRTKEVEPLSRHPYNNATCYNMTSLWICCGGKGARDNPRLVRCLSTSVTISGMSLLMSSGNTFSSSEGCSKTSNWERSRSAFM